jgi:hypothetical protein
MDHLCVMYMATVRNEVITELLDSLRRLVSKELVLCFKVFFIFPDD